MAHGGLRGARPSCPGCVSLARAARGNGKGANRGGFGPKLGADANGGVQRAVRGRGEREAVVSGNFVNRPNFQIQFCNFDFTPPRWAQRKTC